VVIEKGLQDRVEIIVARTRSPGSPYYRINPSGRVPYLVDASGLGMEDSRLICEYLDGLDGKPRFHGPASERDWARLRMEAAARSMCDGVSVWVREMRRPPDERSPTILAHEAARSRRMADVFENEVAGPLLQGAPAMTHLILAVALEFARSDGLGDLTEGRPHLAAWLTRVSSLPALRATATP